MSKASTALCPATVSSLTQWGVHEPVISRRRSTIICRWRVVGTSRPSSRDKFPKWKTKWWACSQSWQEVMLGSTVGICGVAEGKECIMGKRLGDCVEDILHQGHFQSQDKPRGGQCSGLVANAKANIFTAAQFNVTSTQILNLTCLLTTYVLLYISLFVCFTRVHTCPHCHKQPLEEATLLL